MNSEKVKEIKKALKCCKQNEIEDTCEYCLDCPASDWDYEKERKIDLFQNTLTLINELESENEKLLDSVETVQNNRCVYKCELTKRTLKQFAERLIEKCNDKNAFICSNSITATEIDETLKECLCEKQV